MIQLKDILSLLTLLLKLNLYKDLMEKGIKIQNLSHFHKSYQKEFNKLDKVFLRNLLTRKMSILVKLNSKTLLEHHQIYQR